MMAAEERDHRSSSMTGVVASPHIFLLPGFADILLVISTLSVTLSWSDNRAKHTERKISASSERYNKWFSRFHLAAKLISRSVDSYFCRSIQRDFGLELPQQLASLVA